MPVHIANTKSRNFPSRLSACRAESHIYGFSLRLKALVHNWREVHVDLIVWGPLPKFGVLIQTQLPWAQVEAFPGRVWHNSQCCAIGSTNLQCLAGYWIKREEVHHDLKPGWLWFLVRFKKGDMNAFQTTVPLQKPAASRGRSIAGPDEMPIVFILTNLGATSCKLKTFRNTFGACDLRRDTSSKAASSLSLTVGAPAFSPSSAPTGGARPGSSSRQAHCLTFDSEKMFQTHAFTSQVYAAP